MKKLSDMTDEEKAAFVKQLDEALLPFFHYIEAGLLDVCRWVATVMKAVAEGADPLARKLFEGAE